MKNGDLIQDNDPRSYSGKRILKVLEGCELPSQQYVIAQGVHNNRTLWGKQVRIAKRRIYGDGKVRKSGFTILKSKESK